MEMTDGKHGCCSRTPKLVDVRPKVGPDQQISDWDDRICHADGLFQYPVNAGMAQALTGAGGRMARAGLLMFGDLF